jgi:hypothetical protein
VAEDCGDVKAALTPDAIFFRNEVGNTLAKFESTKNNDRDKFL